MGHCHDPVPKPHNKDGSVQFGDDFFVSGTFWLQGVLEHLFTFGSISI